MTFPELTTHSLILDRINEDDLNEVFELFSNAEVTKYYDLEFFTTLEQAEKIINLFHSRYTKSLGIRWAIRVKDTNKLIGTCGFNSWNVRNNSTVIGYDLNQQYWGKGITTQAVVKIIEFAFSGQLYCGTINRIQADTVVGNTASETVLKKLKFIEEGTLRQSGFWKNKYHDLKCFSLLKNEF